MNVLVCGHTSFASQGLPELLRRAGYEVTCFGRGPVSSHTGAAGLVVTGDANRVDVNPHLDQPFDAVINYILLKDDDIEANHAFSDALARLCEKCGVKHLIHISSVSAYRGSLKRVDETSELEADPLKKGAYGSLKVAADNRLMERLPPTVKLSMVRPGFILGPGLMDPIVGSAARLPWNKLLLIGAGGTQFPMVSREQVNRAVMKLLAEPPAEARESLLLVSPDSPTKREFIRTVAREFGGGTDAVVLPTWLWWVIAVGAEGAAWVLGQRKLKPFSKLASRLRSQRFDSTRTQRRLGSDLRLDWRAELRQSLDHQVINFELPYDPASQPQFGSKKVGFIGYGRIVLQKHVPALKRLSFDGPIEACDLHGFVAKDGRQVKPLPSCDLSDSDLVVIASPGPAHTEAIERLRMASGANVLVEKPLCYSAEELAQWRSFAADHSGRVLVCHNYRYKRNVVEMVRFLKVHPPGALHHVHLEFSSPAVTNDSVAWMRNERRARTLLLDYSLHFVDIACMFARPETRWEIDHCRHELNARGQTSVIEGNVRADYSVSFVLRQGFAPRRTRLLFTFQNYSVSLGFFPETFVPHMSNDSPWLYKREQKVRARATRQKILDKLLNRDSDMSHAAVFAAAGAPTDAAPGLTVERVAPFYDLLFRLADRVYGAAGVGPGGEVAAAPAAPNPTGAGSRRIEARTAT